MLHATTGNVQRNRPTEHPVTEVEVELGPSAGAGKRFGTALVLTACVHGTAFWTTFWTAFWTALWKALWKAFGKPSGQHSSNLLDSILDSFLDYLLDGIWTAHPMGRQQT